MVTSSAIDGTIQKYIPPGALCGRSCDAAFISLKIKKNFIEKNISLTTDKIDGSMDFSVLPVGSCTLSIVGVLCAKQYYIFVN